MRDKLSVPQFVTALTSSEMQRHLRFGEFTSLGAVVTRALLMKAVKTMSRGPSVEFRAGKRKASHTYERPEKKRRLERFDNRSDNPMKTCWLCVKLGHLQKDCQECRDAGGDRISTTIAERKDNVKNRLILALTTKE